MYIIIIYKKVKRQSLSPGIFPSEVSFSYSIPLLELTP